MMTPCTQCGKSVASTLPNGLCPTCDNAWKDATLIIGEFGLRYYDGNPKVLWLYRTSGEREGEGMSVPTEQLEAALSHFWKENF